MPTRTSSQAGNTNSAPFAFGSAVNAGDDLVVNHAVAVDASVAVATVAINAAMTVNTGVTLTVAGTVTQGDAAFTLSAGSHLVFDSTSADVKWLFGDAASFTTYANCGLFANGTSGSHCTVTKTGSHFCWFDDFSENGAGAGKTAYDCTYTDFTNVGKSDGSVSLAISDFGARNQRLNHCTFDGCGAVFPIRPFEWDASGNKDYVVADCRWTNTASGVATLKATVGTGTGSGTRQIVRNVFDREPAFNVGGGITVEDNLFKRGYTYLGRVPGSFNNNCFIIENGSTEVVAPLSTSGGYWVAGQTYPGNPHCVNGVPTGATISGWVFENPNALAIDGGECVYTVGRHGHRHRQPRRSQ
jgi:hypothetical protein